MAERESGEGALENEHGRVGGREGGGWTGREAQD